MKKLHLLFTFYFLPFTFISFFHPLGGQRGALAQDIHFTQYYHSPLLLNPSNAGRFGGDYRFGANYRNQWKSVTVPYKTYSLFFDRKIRKEFIGNDYAGGGIAFYSDKSGTGELSTLAALVNLAYHRKFGMQDQHLLSAGLSGAYVQKNVDYSNLRFHNQYESVVYNNSLSSGESFPSESFQYPDFSAGAHWQSSFSEKLIAGGGFTWFHLTKPRESFYGVKDNKLNTRISFAAEGSYFLNEKTSLNGGINYQTQAKAKEFQFALFGERELKKSPLATISGFAGITGRFTGWDAVALLGGIEYNNLRTAISYDINTSSLSEASKGKGAFEIAIIYIFNAQQRIGIQKTVPCIRL